MIDIWILTEMTEPPSIGSWQLSANGCFRQQWYQRTTGEILSGASYVEQPSVDFRHMLVPSPWEDRRRWLCDKIITREGWSIRKEWLGEQRGTQCQHTEEVHDYNCQKASNLRCSVGQLVERCCPLLYSIWLELGRIALHHCYGLATKWRRRKGKGNSALAGISCVASIVPSKHRGYGSVNIEARKGRKANAETITDLTSTWVLERMAIVRYTTTPNWFTFYPCPRAAPRTQHEEQLRFWTPPGFASSYIELAFDFLGT